MAGITNTLEALTLAHWLKGTALPQPTAITVSLWTTAPDPELSTGGVEVSGGSYARATCNAWTVSGTAPTQAANTSAVTFTTPSAGWGNVVAFGVHADGVLWMTTTLNLAKTINQGDTVSFSSGTLIVTLD